MTATHLLAGCIAITIVAVAAVCLTCSEVQLGHPQANVKYTPDGTVCASTFHNKCSGMVVFAEAEAYCDLRGMTLCSRNQLATDVPAGTGCGYDLALCWSRTACTKEDGTAGFVAMPGHSKYATLPTQRSDVGVIEEQCLAPIAETAAARCCGVSVCTKETAAPTRATTDAPTTATTDAPTTATTDAPTITTATTPMAIDDGNDSDEKNIAAITEAAVATVPSSSDIYRLRWEMRRLMVFLLASMLLNGFFLMYTLAVFVLAFIAGVE